MKKRLLVLVVLAALLAGARTIEKSAWKGETLAFIVNDSLEELMEGAEYPDGFELRYGTVEPVNYRPWSGSLQLKTCYDRVEWDRVGDGLERGVGPRILEVRVPADAEAKTYEIGALRLQVIDRVLPPAKEWKFFLDLWQHPFAVARAHGVVPFSAEHYAAMEPLWRLLATAGQKVLTVSICDQPWDHQCHDAYTSMLTEDFRLFDEYIEFGRRCGIGPNIALYSLCPWGRELVLDEAKAHELERLAAHLRAKGWLEQTYLAMDERTPEQVKAVIDFVAKHAPGMKISMAGNVPAERFAKLEIENYSQIMFDLNETYEKAVAERRREGKISTFYTCCVPDRPNTFLESDESEPYYVGAYAGLVGLDGYLRWAYNSWPRNPYADASAGWWKAGDAFLAYPGAEPSIRFLELRNGIIAAEKLRMLKEQGVAVEPIQQLAQKYGFRAAMDGKLDLRKFRQELEALVNQPPTSP